MRLTKKHLKLYKQVLSDGINRRCSDTNREYYKDWTPIELYDFNYRALELRGDLQEWISEGYTIKNNFR